MPYPKCKIYSDGGHYIAIPHTTRPYRPRKKPKEEVIAVTEEVDEETQTPAAEQSAPSIEDAPMPLERENEVNDNAADCVEIANTLPEKPPTSRLMTKKELFEELYAKYQSLPRYKRKAAILKRMRPYFKTEEEAKTYVEANMQRKLRNLISRRVRMVRKVNLQDFNFFVTVNNDYWFYCGVATDENYPFTEQVQNGGSCLWISYYDLLARREVLGADNAYSRLDEIAEWYSQVKQAYNDALSQGVNLTAKEFYRAFYYDIARCSAGSYNVFNETCNPQHIVLQGQVNGRDSAGGLGLDAEFLENAVLCAAIPEAFLGLGSEDYRTLRFEPSLPESLSYLKLENLYFQGWQYDVCAGANYLRISDIREVSSGSGRTDLSLTVSFEIPDGEYRVYVDGQMVQSTEQNGRVFVTIPFGSTFVKIG